MTGSPSYWIAAALVATVALAVLLGGCEIRTAGAPASHPATPASPAAAAQPTAAPTPDTAAGARSAAQAMFDLYAAEQYAAVYPMIDAQARAAVPEHKWVAVHEKCPPEAAGLTGPLAARSPAGDDPVSRAHASGGPPEVHTPAVQLEVGPGVLRAAARAVGDLGGPLNGSRCRRPS